MAASDRTESRRQASCRAEDPSPGLRQSLGPESRCWVGACWSKKRPRLACERMGQTLERQRRLAELPVRAAAEGALSARGGSGGWRPGRPQRLLSAPGISESRARPASCPSRKHVQRSRPPPPARTPLPPLRPPGRPARARRSWQAIPGPPP